MTPCRQITFLVPDDIDNPARPSGGNEYDRQLAAGLRKDGWTANLRTIPTPRAARAGAQDTLHAVASAVAELADGATVLVDGLFVAPAAEVLAAHAGRLRLVVLMHVTMALPPPGHEQTGAAAAERSVLDLAAAVIATSQWLRRQIVTRQRIGPERVWVAPPGVGGAPVARSSPAGDRLLCVAAVAPHKGHDVLLAALARLADLVWTCTCVGSLERDADFAAALRARAVAQGIDDRLVFAGACTRDELADNYASNDLLVLPTRSESYGMVLTEALARGLPVVASDVGGVVEAATGTPSSAAAIFPGALVPVNDPGALADQLRTWLTDAATRAVWRQRAEDRRATLSGWGVTARRAADALEHATAGR